MSGRDLCIVKVGGAAITKKDSFETLNAEHLEHFVENVIKPISSTKRVIIVHGAGSFGHFQAKQYSLTQCNGPQDVNKAGVALTQQSVRKLHSNVIASLIKHDVPAVSVSPFPSWITKNGAQVISSNISEISKLLSLGLIPVLHGDVILDDVKGVTILSGDTIISYLSKLLKPKYVTFITDVDGVFDRPPNQKGDVVPPKLLRDIFVNKEGKIVTSFEASESSVSQDVTGGMKSKIESSIEVVLEGIPVFIAKAGTEHAVAAARGELPIIGTCLALYK